MDFSLIVLLGPVVLWWLLGGSLHFQMVTRCEFPRMGKESHFAADNPGVNELRSGLRNCLSRAGTSGASGGSGNKKVAKQRVDAVWAVSVFLLFSLSSESPG